MIKFLILGFINLVSLAVQSSESDKLVTAFQNSNVNEISAMFISSIELTTPSSSGVSTKEQAKIILENFLRNNKPSKAALFHESSGTSNSMIVISLTTSNGNFRVTVIGAYKMGGFLINELKILQS